MWNFLDRHFEELLGSVLLAVMALVAFVNVVVRYCSSFSFAWSEELTTNLFVWVVLLGTSCAFKNQSNLCVELIYKKLPPGLRGFCYAAGLLLSSLFFAALCYTGVLEVLDEIELERVSDSLELPYWIYSMAVPLFSALIIVRIVQRAVRDVRGHRI